MLRRLISTSSTSFRPECEFPLSAFSIVCKYTLCAILRRTWTNISDKMRYSPTHFSGKLTTNLTQKPPMLLCDRQQFCNSESVSEREGTSADQCRAFTTARVFLALLTRPASTAFYARLKLLSQSQHSQVGVSNFPEGPLGTHVRCNSRRKFAVG